MRYWLIDTDPGVDDALALMIAHALAGDKIVALGIAAGNVDLARATRNALLLTELLDWAVPIHPGAPDALLHRAPDAAFVHGRDGFGDAGLPLPARRAEAEPAALAILRLTAAAPGQVGLLMLGPLTNLALALSLDPALPERVPRLVLMGGAVTGRGNHDHLPAEFNVHFDTEAAAIVCSRWPRFDLVDWEATLAHGLDAAEIERWLAADGDRTRFYRAISRKTREFQRRAGRGTWHAADALAVAVALAPEGVLAWVERPLAVETGPGLARGATLVDWDRRMGWPVNARILRRYDRQRFAALVRAGLGLV